MTETKTPGIIISLQSLLELYIAEKNEADHFEEFPTFSDWRDQYASDRQEEMDNTDVSDVLLIDENSDKQPRVKVKTQPVKKKGLTNMDKARTIFESMIVGDVLPLRKDVVDRFMAELKISKACASTYNHNVRQKFV